MRIKLHLVKPALVLAALSVSLTVSMAETWYVAPEGSDSASGKEGWENALATIEAAVGKAAVGDTVLYASGRVNWLAHHEIPVSEGVFWRGRE